VEGSQEEEVMPHFRSSVTGRYVKEEHALKNPRTTVKEKHAISEQGSVANGLRPKQEVGAQVGKEVPSVQEPPKE
jgi:hypothetical protein